LDVFGSYQFAKIFATIIFTVFGSFWNIHTVFCPGQSHGHSLPVFHKAMKEGKEKGYVTLLRSLTTVLSSAGFHMFSSSWNQKTSQRMTYSRVFVFVIKWWFIMETLWKCMI
jgi:hypothetical protein